MKRFVVYWALAGVLVPITILFVDRLQGGVFVSPYLALALWPTSVIYAAADSYQNPQASVVVISLLISIGLNAAIYSYVGLNIWRLWLLFGERRRKRDEQ
jgi:hypothetical protein